MINVFFFLLPFFLYCGIVAQALGFYICLILAPLILLARKRAKIPNALFSCALFFILMYAVFPVGNFLVPFLPHITADPLIYQKVPFALGKMLKSYFPSSLFISSLALLLFQIISKYRKHSNSTFEPSAEPFTFFLRGLAIFSCIFTCFAFYQYFTGINYKFYFQHASSPLLDPSDRLRSMDRYRVFVLYGHPLTLASIGLAYVSFSWYLLCKGIFEKTYPAKILILLAIITLANELSLIASGGRTAILLSLAFLIALPAMQLRKTKQRGLAIGLMGTMVLLLGWAAFQGNLASRFVHTWHMLQSGHTYQSTGDYRPVFWRVYLQMFQDSPWVGQGYYWIHKGVREIYYNHLGYQSLPYKYPAHNAYLETLACVGILGFIGIGWCAIRIKQIISSSLMSLKTNPLWKAWGISLFANALHGLTQNTFFDSGVFYIYISLFFLIIWQLLLSFSPKQTP